MFHPGVGQYGRIWQGPLDAFKIDHGRRLAGNGTRHQHRIGNRGKHRGAGAIRERTTVKAVGEFSRDVVKPRHAARPQPIGIAHGSTRVRGPDAHVGGIGAGENLAHKPRPRSRGHGKAGLRVPKHIDAKGYGDFIAQAANHIGHSRRGCGVDLQFIGPVVFVTKHHRIEPGGLQGVQISAGVGQNAFDATVSIIERRAGRRAQVYHGNDGFVGPENVLKARHLFLPDRGTLSRNILDGKQDHTSMPADLGERRCWQHDTGTDWAMAV